METRNTGAGEDTKERERERDLHFQADRVTGAGFSLLPGTTKICSKYMEQRFWNKQDSDAWEPGNKWGEPCDCSQLPAFRVQAMIQERTRWCWASFQSGGDRAENTGQGQGSYSLQDRAQGRTDWNTEATRDLQRILGVFWRVWSAHVCDWPTRGTGGHHTHQSHRSRNNACSHWPNWKASWLKGHWTHRGLCPNSGKYSGLDWMLLWPHTANTGSKTWGIKLSLSNLSESQNKVQEYLHKFKNMQTQQEKSTIHNV